MKAIGNPGVVDAQGSNSCTHVVLQMATQADPAATSAAMAEVGLTSAGERPAPAAGEPRHPVFELFWTSSGESQALEADLAQSFGPEEAKRLVYAKAMCGSSSHFGERVEPRQP